MGDKVSCNIIVKKPHVLTPEDDDRFRADNLNRNFNDAWSYFEAFRKCVKSLDLSIQNIPGAADLSNYYTKQEVNGLLLKPGWDDLRVSLVNAQKGGVQDPDFIQVKDDGSGSTGVFAYGFDAGTEEELFFAVQIPHDWKEGTAIRPHIHWCPTNTNTGSVSFGLEYTKATNGSAFGNTTILDVQQAGSGTAYEHQIAAWDEISMTGDKISTMLLCRVFRDAGGSLGTDDYNADAVLLEVDFHYKRNDLGSRAEYKK